MDNGTQALSQEQDRTPISYYLDRVGIVLIHGGTVYAFWRGASLRLIGLAAGSYAIRMFAITGGYHRYFSHRSFRTSRLFQFLLALLGTTATQKGPLWWAAAHRHHHRYSDLQEDFHSPKHHGFWQAHLGWWWAKEHDTTDWKQVKDLARFPELRFLDRFYVVGVVGWMALAAAIAGFDGFLWGYVVSTFFVTHATFLINSLAHVYGSRRYETSDTSRNSFWLALLTMGEGWHNNHHHFMGSANQGFFWWEIDVTYYILKALSWIGVVWDLRRPRDISSGLRKDTDARARAAAA
jgi:stearoyl-CoA desaturase (delta-9 desaturase)